MYLVLSSEQVVFLQFALNHLSFQEEVYTVVVSELYYGDTVYFASDEASISTHISVKAYNAILKSFKEVVKL